jgi:hypothetical protein
VQSSATAVLIPNSTARRLMTGSVPGIPWQMGQVRVLGSPPNIVEHPQNILLAVASCA